MTTVLICEPFPVVRYGLTLMLNKAFPNANIVETEQPSEIFALPSSSKFDLVIIEASNNATEDPVFNIQRIRERYPQTVILVFSHKDENDAGLPIIRAGADGYLSKIATIENFTEAIQAILRREKYLSPELRQKLMNDLITGRESQPLTGAVHLTSRERDVLDGLIKGSRIFEIANGLGIHNSTVSAVKRSILAKMKVQNVIELAEKMKK